MMVVRLGCRDEESPHQEEVALAHLFYVGKQFPQRSIAEAAKDPAALSDADLVTAAVHGAATIGCYFGADPGLCVEPRTSLQKLEDELRRRLGCTATT